MHRAIAVYSERPKARSSSSIASDLFFFAGGREHAEVLLKA